jgi:hypothetical protein
MVAISPAYHLFFEYSLSQSWIYKNLYHREKKEAIKSGNPDLKKQQPYQLPV